MKSDAQPARSGPAAAVAPRCPVAINRPPRAKVWWTASALLLLGTLALGLSGCETKASADARVKAAFLAGQKYGMETAPTGRAQGNVTLIGEVRNPVILWTPGLTLAQALVIADYTGAADPGEIILLRNGLARVIDPKTLLSGQDVPLEAADIVQVNQQPQAIAMPEPGP